MTDTLIGKLTTAFKECGYPIGTGYITLSPVHAAFLAKVAAEVVSQGEIQVDIGRVARRIACLDNTIFKNTLENCLTIAKYALDMAGIEYSGPKRESVEVSDFDAEVAIAEGLYHSPKSVSYEEAGVPILKHLKSLGYRIVNSDDSTITDEDRNFEYEGPNQECGKD